MPGLSGIGVSAAISGAFYRGGAAKLLAWCGAGQDGGLVPGDVGGMAEIRRLRVRGQGVLEGRCWKGGGKAMLFNAMCCLGT
jgi:hypothetical protein